MAPCLSRRLVPALVTAAVLAGLATGTAAAQAPAAQASSAAPTPSLIHLPPAQLLRHELPVGTARPGATTGPSLRPATRARAVRAPQSTWNVQYTGFPPDAKAAFQAAVDTWAGLVSSSQPINVCATFKDLGGTGVLGQAGPTAFTLLHRDANGGDAPTYYPLALADALTGTDLSPVTNPTDPCSGTDITATFSSTEPCVYYGTDGLLPATCPGSTRGGGYVDFETIVLHELAHGLGFLGSADVSSGFGYFGTRAQPDPTVYDRFVVQSGGAVQGKHLVGYPVGSTALGRALTSNALYWDGALGKAADQGRPIRLYAPSTFGPASSFSHLYDADFPAGDPNSLMTPFLASWNVVHDPGPVLLGMLADEGWQVPAQAGVAYSPVDPVRVLDTRTGIGGPAGRLGTGRLMDVSVVGGTTGVPADATAVVVNVTGIAPASATDLRVYATPRSGNAQPLVSSLNVTAGVTRANLVTVTLGAGGRIRLLNSGGPMDVLVDVDGWYGAAAGSTYQPAAPVRLLDTRDGTGSSLGAITGGGSIDLPVTGGPLAVPATATAVILTVTALDATAPTDVRVYPTPADSTATPPNASSLNVTPGQVVPNAVIVKIGSGGSIRLSATAGTVDLVADLSGWYDQSPTGGLLHVLAPKRVLDTRLQSVKVLGPGSTRDVPVSGAAGVPPAGAAAVVLNVTGISATQPTDVAAYPTPGDASVPATSTLGLRAHETAAAMAVVPTGRGGQIRLRNAAGSLGLAVDLEGWFGP